MCKIPFFKKESICFEVLGIASLAIGYCLMEGGNPPFVFITTDSAESDSPTSSPEVLQSVRGTDSSPHGIFSVNFFSFEIRAISDSIKYNFISLGARDI